MTHGKDRMFVGKPTSNKWPLDFTKGYSIKKMTTTSDIQDYKIPNLLIQSVNFQTYFHSLFYVYIFNVAYKNHAQIKYQNQTIILSQIN